ncbi:MAG: helix-turn-helix domain-containing protein [Verrucomicrobiae bacterium]|nr:helix-turn-helix domain-containing protein [Verrucomicrobiae bacterium]
MPPRYRLKDLVRPDPSYPFSMGPAHLNHEDFEYHTHDFSEIAIVTSGTCRHLVEGVEHPIAPGNVYVFNGNTAHAFLETRDLHIINLMYDPDFFFRTERDLKSLPGFHTLFRLEPMSRARGEFRGWFRLTPPELVETRRMADRILEEYRGQKPGWKTLVRSRLMDMVIYLSRLYTEKSRRSPDSGKLSRIGEALAFMETHHAQPLKLEEIAARAHLSVNQFLRVFRETHHCTPVEHLIRLRVARACELLSRGSPKITSIAFECGFSDSNYFSRQFRRVMQCSPREYRLRHGPDLTGLLSPHK